MNTAHLHLLLNHFPIIGIMIGTLILVAGFIFKNNQHVKQTALGVLFFSSLTAIPAFLTGEGAEELVENIQGVSEAAIETHEDGAKTFLIITIILGVVSLAAFLASYFKSKLSSLLYLVVLALSIVAGVFAKQVGTSGGEIRHSEIRANNTTTNNATNAQENNQETEDDD